LKLKAKEVHEITGRILAIDEVFNWLRYYHMGGIWGGFLSLASIPDFQHCTDEAQKAETVLSAVIYTKTENGQLLV